MTQRFPYDSAAFDPPAPVVPLRVVATEGDAAVLLHAIVDSGADCTLLPAWVPGSLGLRYVERADIAGIDGQVRSARVHAARIEFAGHGVVAGVVCWGDEAILGRDLLRSVTVSLDGPKQRLSIRTGR